MITTCSPRNFEYVKSLGADAAFDYRSPTCAADIKAYTNGAIRHAWDCIANPDATRICVAALSDDGGAYGSLLGVPADLVHSVNPKVTNAVTMAYTVFGEGFTKQRVFAPVPADFEFGKTFWELSRELLVQGKIKPAKPIVNQGGAGLEGVLVGLEDLKNGKVSGGKLVYTI